ncbi:MAG: DNA primase [Actinomycetales bacterium]|nr:DNA primase [Actinomycetales bacterium]
MAGRISAEDVTAVREGSRIEQIVGDHVTLRRAGPDSLTGLCPFHDERSPSFTVTPTKGLWYCFGCGEGGDVFDFQRRIDSSTFAEAVERLAQRAGITVRYERGGAVGGADQGQRTRLMRAVSLSAAFFSEALTSAAAAPARQFLTARGFGPESWEQFGLGFAPSGWDSLLSHLRGHGVSEADILGAGLAITGTRGLYDRFRGRLIWPIRQADGQAIGFGARRLADDDTGPKYLNSPETPLYQKSRVLYGLDRARVAIARQRQIVIVEGYTDVMACHLAGVPTAVATCGTAFGAEHARIVRRLLTDADRLSGEVIFTFDGDEAGRRAAVRAFEQDQQFAASTFIALQPDGMDPCDLRLARGDGAVRALLAGRVPLVEFIIRSALAQYDLDTAEGRVAALRATAPHVAGIRDRALQPEYARLLAGWLGVPESAVRAEIADQARRPEQTRGAVAGGEPVPAARRAATPSQAQTSVSAADRAGRLIEREALRLALQHPRLAWSPLHQVDIEAFAVSSARAVAQLLGTGEPPGDDERGWRESVLARAPDDAVRQVVLALTVEPLLAEATAGYVTTVFARLGERHLDHRISDLRGRLERQQDAPPELFAELLACEAARRGLRQQAAGG